MTVEEVLRQSGFTDQEIRAMDNRAVVAFNGLVSQAEQERQQAEQARRANVDLYEGQIAPSLVAWEEEKNRMEADRARDRAEVAYYREVGRANGIPDPPNFQGRDQGGRYVAGAPGGTPGSPQFFDVNQVYERAGDAVSMISDIQWEHERLFGAKMPISPSELVKQADRVKLDPRTYAARTFNWDAKKQEIQKKAQEDHDNQIKKEVTAERDRYWAERVGSNPDVRAGMDSKYSDHARAVKAGTRPDPLALSEEQRRVATRQMIREDLSENANQ